MSFSQFKNIAEVQKKYNIRYEEADFISALDIAVPQIFVEEFKFNKAMVRTVKSK